MDVPVFVSASQILARLLTVDANDSGLNANTLQGYVATDFALASALSGYLAATGATAGGTTTRQSFGSGLTLTGGIRPASDSTTALQWQNAAGTAIVTVDTTNGTTKLVSANAYQLHVSGKGRISGDSNPQNSGEIRLGSTTDTTKSGSIHYYGNGPIMYFDVGDPNGYWVFRSNGGHASPTTRFTIGATGSLDLLARLTVFDATQEQINISGWDSNYGQNSNNGEIKIGSNNRRGSIHFDGTSAHAFFFDIKSDVPVRDFIFRTETGGVKTEVWRLGLTGAQIATMSDSGTTTVLPVITAKRRSSGTAAAGLGVSFLAQLQSSTTTDQSAGRIVTLWNDATHATRQADMVFSAWYTSTEHEFMRGRGGSAAPMIGVLGATPALRQTVTGSRTDGTALASLLTAMATFGWITDSSTA